MDRRFVGLPALALLLSACTQLSPEASPTPSPPLTGVGVVPEPSCSAEALDPNSTAELARDDEGWVLEGHSAPYYQELDLSIGSATICNNTGRTALALVVTIPSDGTVEPVTLLGAAEGPVEPGAVLEVQIHGRGEAMGEGNDFIVDASY